MRNYSVVSVPAFTTILTTSLDDAINQQATRSRFLLNFGAQIFRCPSQEADLCVCRARHCRNGGHALAQDEKSHFRALTRNVKALNNSCLDFSCLKTEAVVSWPLGHLSCASFASDEKGGRRSRERNHWLTPRKNRHNILTSTSVDHFLSPSPLQCDQRFV